MSSCVVERFFWIPHYWSKQTEFTYVHTGDFLFNAVIPVAIITGLAHANPLIGLITEFTVGKWTTIVGDVTGH
jgi:hypothetical protein